MHRWREDQQQESLERQGPRPSFPAPALGSRPPYDLDTPSSRSPYDQDTPSSRPPTYYHPPTPAAAIAAITSKSNSYHGEPYVPAVVFNVSIGKRGS